MSPLLRPAPVSPIPEESRGSGVLLHVTSLPGPYGVGDLGPVAREWVEMLSAAGQTWWQILPLGPTGSGFCPYQLLTTHGITPVVLSPDDLIEDGLLTRDDLPTTPRTGACANFPGVNAEKLALIGVAWERFCQGVRSDLQTEFQQFIAAEADWLEDYALFVALERQCGTSDYTRWPKELAFRDWKALEAIRAQCQADIFLTQFAQFLLSRQMRRLKQHANEQGVRIIGDLPFFVAPGSVDVWTHPELFQLDDQLQPLFMAGVPPDYFSPYGQLWGNPVYHWDTHRSTGFAWWYDRLVGLLKYVDVVRLDHFRGFAAAWHVPRQAQTAMEGTWVPGPGAEILDALRKKLGGLPVLAEDLGEITPDVIDLRDQFQLTGMRVLQFAFDGNPQNPFLPEQNPHNTVAYTATHDNDTTLGWYLSLTPRTQAEVRQLLHRTSIAAAEVPGECVRCVWESAAGMAIAPLQDILALDHSHRMNTPGCPDGNWTWICPSEQFQPSLLNTLHRLTLASGRASQGHFSEDKNRR